MTSCSTARWRSRCLFPELSVDRSFVERFRREAQAAANLSHPNIVPVFDWGEDNGTYFIVMEFVDGRALSSILRTAGPLHPDRAAEIAADVAGALAYAHRHGVVHRDVKPGNVLITEEGTIKVTDFGIARAVNTEESLTQTGAVMGTATYFSPEQAEGMGVDSRSDIYSLGVVLFEMVTGRPPFLGDTPVAVASKHVREHPPAPREMNSGVPPDLEAIILKCLAKSPDHRYATGDDLRIDLLRFREGRAVGATAPPDGPAPRGRHPGRRPAVGTQALPRSPATTSTRPGAQPHQALRRPPRPAPGGAGRGHHLPGQLRGLVAHRDRATRRDPARRDRPERDHGRADPAPQGPQDDRARRQERPPTRQRRGEYRPAPGTSGEEGPEDHARSPAPVGHRSSVPDVADQSVTAAAGQLQATGSRPRCSQTALAPNRTSSAARTRSPGTQARPRRRSPSSPPASTTTTTASAGGARRGRRTTRPGVHGLAKPASSADDQSPHAVEPSRRTRDQHQPGGRLTGADGDDVNLVVSSGPSSVLVPYVVGDTQAGGDQPCRQGQSVSS